MITMTSIETFEVEPESPSMPVPPTAKMVQHVHLHAVIGTEARDRLDTYQAAHGFTNRNDALNALLLDVLPAPQQVNMPLHPEEA